jgi:hypothetical protein
MMSTRKLNKELGWQHVRCYKHAAGKSYNLLMNTVGHVIASEATEVRGMGSTGMSSIVPFADANVVWRVRNRHSRSLAGWWRDSTLVRFVQWHSNNSISPSGSSFASNQIDLQCKCSKRTWPQCKCTKAVRHWHRWHFSNRTGEARSQAYCLLLMLCSGKNNRILPSDYWRQNYPGVVRLIYL